MHFFYAPDSLRRLYEAHNAPTVLAMEGWKDALAEAQEAADAVPETVSMPDTGGAVASRGPSAREGERGSVREAEGGEAAVEEGGGGRIVDGRMNRRIEVVRQVRQRPSLPGTITTDSEHVHSSRLPLPARRLPGASQPLPAALVTLSPPPSLHLLPSTSLPPSFSPEQAVLERGFLLRRNARRLLAESEGLDARKMDSKTAYRVLDAAKEAHGLVKVTFMGQTLAGNEIEHDAFTTPAFAADPECK